MVNFDYRINFILSNIFLTKEIGLSYGHMGGCLYLAQYVKENNDDKVESIVCDLLTYILSIQEDRISYNYGEIGIGIGLMNLIKRDLIKANYLDLFSLHHNHIISSAININSLDSLNNKNYLDIADIILYIVYYSFFSLKEDSQNVRLLWNLFNKIEAKISDLVFDSLKYQILEKLIVASEIMNNAYFSSKIKNILFKIINGSQELKIDYPPSLLRLIYLFSFSR